jgi:hypothetical protein
VVSPTVRAARRTYGERMAERKERAMTKRTKIAMATVFTALIAGGAGWAGSPALAEEQQSVGTTAYRTVLVATETQYGAVAVRVINRAIENGLRDYL